MNKEIEIPEGYEARIEGNKVIIAQKESEDERIRKELMNFVAKVKDIAKNGRDSWAVRKEDVEMCERFLAYLEKQREQKPAEQLDCTFTPYDMAKTFMEGQNYVIAHPEKFGLYKPAEWSEEDANYMEEIISNLKYAAKNRKTCPNKLAEKCIYWLEARVKSLHPQPSGNLAISFMNYLDEHRPDGKMCLSNGECANIETAFKREDWAMIIRYINKYQPHWKPSEEQMKALGAAIVLHKTDPFVEMWQNLYDDLQKMR